MVTTLDSRSRGLGSSPGRVIVVFLGKTLYSHSASLYPEYKRVPANCQGNMTKCWEVTCDGLASHPGGVAMSLSYFMLTTLEASAPQGTWLEDRLDTFLIQFMAFIIHEIISTNLETSIYLYITLVSARVE